MKFINLLTKKLFALLTIFSIILLVQIECLKEKKYQSNVNSENTLASERNTRRGKSLLRSEANPPVSNKTNSTLGVVFNSFVNKSAQNVDLRTFRESNQNTKFHLMFDKQIEEIFLIFRNSKIAGVSDFRTTYNLFIANFNKCDKDKDLLLNSKEFADCMKTDPYLSLIQAPDRLYTTNKEFTTNATAFANNLFMFADNYDKRGLNFYDYVVMRLMALSWRKCSVNNPFIDESSFECAIDFISGSRSLHSNSLRKLFNLALELGNSKSQPVRTLDFVIFYAFASSVRLFGKINAKENMDATNNEFNIALDTNILPTRYSQSIIDDLFRLVRSSGKNGIDLYSFCFYDHFLKLFYQGYQSEKRWKISLKELNDITNFYLFPAYIINYLRHVPQANYTVDSFNLRAHIVPSMYSEDDNLAKFLEVGSSAERYNNTAFYKPLVLKRIFSLLDSNEDKFLSFFDFGTFIQTFYLYNLVDERHADRVLIGNLYTRLTEHSDVPAVSDEFRERAKRFSMIDQDLYIDPYYTLAIIRMDDYVRHYLRKSDPTTLKEIELNLVLEKINLKNFPIVLLSKCSRGKDDDGIPKFDWECSITKAITRALTYLEHTRDLSDIKAHGFNLTYTAIDTAPAN